MTLPSSGAISLSNIAGEFGGSTPHAISEYYRGGSNVPNHSNTTSIPTSGQIDFADFYGTSAASPANNTFSGTLGSTAPSFNKYGVSRGGASRTNSPTLFTNTPTPFGSFTDNTFTNPNGTTTFTLDQFWNQLDVFFNGYSQATVSLVGNYTGQNWNAVTGRTGITVNGVSYDLTSSQDGLGNTTTPTFSVQGSVSYITSGVLNTSQWGTSGAFSGTFY
jgi:hypothetical protein